MGIICQGFTHIEHLSCIPLLFYHSNPRKLLIIQQILRTEMTSKPLDKLEMYEQRLHVYDAQYGICLVSRQIEKKSNEIPVAQEVLQALDLRGVLVTFDAMHTQKKTIDIIARGKGYFLGGLKGNKKLLAEEAQVSSKYPRP